LNNTGNSGGNIGFNNSSFNSGGNTGFNNSSFNSGGNTGFNNGGRSNILSNNASSKPNSKVSFPNKSLFATMNKPDFVKNQENKSQPKPMFTGMMGTKTPNFIKPNTKNVGVGNNLINKKIPNTNVPKKTSLFNGLFGGSKKKDPLTGNIIEPAKKNNKKPSTKNTGTSNNVGNNTNVPKKTSLFNGLFGGSKKKDPLTGNIIEPAKKNNKKSNTKNMGTINNNAKPNTKNTGTGNNVVNNKTNNNVVNNNKKT